MHATPVTHDDIKGWGFDARPEDRPGVPAERHPPEPIGSPSWTSPARQQIGTPAVHGAGRPITPTYGTAVPLRGVSGLIRAAAYRVPDYKPRRWLLLMMADRVDVLEHNLAPLAIAIGVLGVGVASARLLRPKRRGLLARLGLASSRDRLM